MRTSGGATTRLLQLYCALFLVEQVMGVALGGTGYVSPAWQVVWAASIGNFVAGVLTLLLSVPALGVALVHGPRPIALLPAWHMGGLLVFSMMQRSAIETLLRAWPSLPPAAIKLAALQSADVQFASLLHSVLGLVLGLQLVLLAASADRPGRRPTLRADRAPAR